MSFFSSLNADITMSVLQFGLFFAVAGIGLSGPNTMALAMSQQGARAGTASAIMGSMQFFCGLLGGIALNFLVWKASFNMGIMMLIFTGSGLLMMIKVIRSHKCI